MAGALKTLFEALQSSQYLAGVSLVFGEEEIGDQSQPLPMVVMVPKGGPIDNDPGYAQGFDPSVERIWGISELVELHLWAYSTDPNAQAIDHSDATEGLRQLVLSALQDQRVQFDAQGAASKGLWFKAISQRWESLPNEYYRYGRELILTVKIEITEAMATPPYATVTTEQITTTITAGP